MPSRHGPARIAAVALVACFAIGPAARGDVPADGQAFQKSVQPFLAAHCLECHAAKASGGVRLDGFRDEAALTNGVETLEKARDMLRKEAMPPKKRPRPGTEETRAVLGWLDRYLAEADRRAAASVGAVVRRLNRAEYNHSVRDLLGVAFQPADDFPADVPGHGFDTSAGTLTVSPVLVEKYLAAAEKVARTALFGVEPLKPERVAHQPWCVADAFSKNRAVKFDYDESGMSLPSALHVVQRFPADGEYTFRCILRGVRPPGSNPVELAFWIDGKQVHETKVEVPERPGGGRNAGELNGKWAECRLPVTAGEHWLSVTILRMYEGLPASYGGPKPSKSEAGNSRATDAFFPMYLDVVGPYQQVLGPAPESLRKIFGTAPYVGPRDAVGARKILADLARRAYRRSVADHEIAELVKLVTAAQQDGDSFEEGLCLAIQRILVSPHFLFRLERSGGSQYELAARLSYFLWSSLPDDELLRCAEERRLRRPDVLEAQVRRMLLDPKSHALVENFGGQWLKTRALESHTPDRTRFSEFTDYTRLSMKQETELFFEHILREDRPVLDFLDGRYTFLNQRLAEFYGISGVKGHAFRKVDLTGTPRGGVWTQGGILAVSSYANRTSPVLRGKWLLENLLNAAPPPPPPNAPSLDEEAVGKAVSLRQQLETHRANAVCASCHARMDPLGFALEHFDAIGAWRDRDGAFSIETAGTMPDGTPFQDHAELRTLLRKNAPAFAECLAEKLLTYALGRELERRDRKAVRAIAAEAAHNDYRFSSLILAVVLSAPFQNEAAR